MWNKLIHDFGTVPEETKLSCTFTYEGTDKIKNVIPACSCSATTLTNNQIEVIYNTSRVPAGLPSMFFEKTIEILFNDNKRDTLTIKGTIVKING
jgi:hypothetical protein